MKRIYSLMVLIVLALTFQNFTTIEAPPASDIVQMRAYFNRPPGYQQKPAKDSPYNLKIRLKKMIESVPKGGTIHASIFAAENEMIKTALIEANRDRAVTLNIVFDNQQTENLEKENFLKAIRQQVDASGLGTVYRCKKGGCIALEGNNHNKFFTFSSTLNDEGFRVQNVSVQTSMNLMEEQEYQYQDMLVVENDVQVYQHYVNYWLALSDSTRTISDNDFMNSDLGHVKSKTLNLKVFSSSSKTEDPILLDLNNIVIDESLSDCKISISQSLLKFDLIKSMDYADSMDEDRAEKLIQKLENLKSLGCEVHVILTNEQKGDPDFAAAISRIQSSPNLFDLILLKDEPTSNKSHSKIVLISAPFRDTDTNDLEIRKIVYAGSMNMTTGSLRQNDDTMFRIRSQKIYDSYLEQFEDLKKNGRKDFNTPLYADYPESSSGNYTFKSGVAIEPQKIRISSGGAAKNCTISATLPSGLTFNKSNCEISGTPTAASTRKTYSITAESSYPNYLVAKVNVSIEVPGVVKPKIAYAATSYSWSVYSQVEIKPIAQGTSGLTYSISPAIPGHISYIFFNKKTGVITSSAAADVSDSPQAVPLLQPTKFTITVKNSENQTASTTLTLSTRGAFLIDSCGGPKGQLCP